MLRTRNLIAMFGVVFILAGCPSGGDDDDDVADDDDDATADDDDAADDDDDAADDDDATAADLTATVTVPAGFDDVPVALYVGYLDGWENGDPVGNGLQLDNPDIGDGNPLEIEASFDGLAGDYIIVVVVYVEGGTPGAEGWPTEGIDHVWYAEDQTLGAGPLDLGTIEVIPWVLPE